MSGVKNSRRPREITRRRFVETVGRAATAGLTFPTIISSSALGLNQTVPPSRRITVGCIGVGAAGLATLQSLLARPEARVVAVCDVDTKRCQEAKALVDRSYAESIGIAKGGCAVYGDFRAVIEKYDVDTLVIATPDHWHGIMAVQATRAGKDVYCEAPLSLTIAEGRAICQTARRYDRIFQTGSHRRSDARFRFACELVKNGLIGKIQAAHVTIPTGPEAPVEPARPVPAGFHYDMWLGPAPWQPYTPKRCHETFRYISDYAGGVLTDVGSHYFDLVHWAVREEDAGPSSVEGEGTFPTDGLFDTAVHVKLEYSYADGFRMTCADRPEPEKAGIRFEGEEGWVEVTEQAFTAEPASLLTRRFSPSDKRLYLSTDHVRNFLDCVKTRSATVAPAEAGHRSATISHLGNIAMLLGRKLEWDPEGERFPKDQKANRLLSRSMRSPWSLF